MSNVLEQAIRSFPRNATAERTRIPSESYTPQETSEIGLRRCIRCGHQGPLEDYVKRSAARYGRLNRCKICMNRERVSKEVQRGANDKRTPESRQASNQKHRRARRDWLWSLKTGQCADCGRTYPPYCMDFDHTSGEKVGDLARLKDRSMEVVMTELTKVELVCANCHRVRTWTRAQALRSNSKYSAYRLRKQQWIWSHLTPCVDCGERLHNAAMEFDHVRGEKNFSIQDTKNLSKSYQAIEREIAKCEVRCSVCHRIRTHERRTGSESQQGLTDFS